jgi:hypothetical protein
MKGILTIKHWQLFALWFTYMCVWMTILNALDLPTTDAFDQFVFVLVPLTAYPFLLGRSLRTQFDVGEHRSLNEVRQFHFYAIVWIVSYTAYYVVRDNVAARSTIGIISILAYFQFAKHPAKMLGLVENKSEPRFWGYLGDIIQMFCWPLFIWSIQPRINRISDKGLKARSIL